MTAILIVCVHGDLVSAVRKPIQVYRAEPVHLGALLAFLAPLGDRDILAGAPPADDPVAVLDCHSSSVFLLEVNIGENLRAYDHPLDPVRQVRTHEDVGTEE